MPLLIAGPSKVQRTSTSRASRHLVQPDGHAVRPPTIMREEASSLFVVDSGRVQVKASSAPEELAVQLAVTTLGGKWRVPILRQLQNGPIHFGELKRRLSPVSKKVLNQQLRQMARERLVDRTEIAGKMPRVVYSLSKPCGHAVLDLLRALAEWGDKNYHQLTNQNGGCMLNRPLSCAPGDEPRQAPHPEARR